MPGREQDIPAGYFRAETGVEHPVNEVCTEHEKPEEPEEPKEFKEPEESVEEVTAQSGHKKQPFVFRMFNRYVTEHNIPTPRVFWLKLKKNNLLFVYELIYFINHNLLDILRLINIGMMTIACVRASPT